VRVCECVCVCVCVYVCVPTKTSSSHGYKQVGCHVNHKSQQCECHFQRTRIFIYICISIYTYVYILYTYDIHRKSYKSYKCKHPQTKHEPHAHMNLYIHLFLYVGSILTWAVARSLGHFVVSSKLASLLICRHGIQLVFCSRPIYDGS
jgi:hypothetical protein